MVVEFIRVGKSLEKKYLKNSFLIFKFMVVFFFSFLILGIVFSLSNFSFGLRMFRMFYEGFDFLG